MPVTAVVLLAAALALLAGAIIRADRRRARELAAALAGMGFQAVPAPPPAHAEALLALYRRGPGRGRRRELARVFRRDAPGGALYVFDVLGDTGKRSGRVASAALGLVRAGARLPSVEVYSAAHLGGPAAILARGLGHGQELRLEDGAAPELTVVCTAEGGEAAARAALGPDVRRRLGQVPFAVLLAGGEALVLQGNPFGPGARGSAEALLRQLVDAAPRAAELLEAGREAPVKER